MPGQLEPLVKDMMAKFDNKDFSGLLAASTDDVEGIDELSRKWMRSRTALDEYFQMVGGAVTDIRSTVSDVHERSWGDTGVATCWVEQDYTLEGNPVHVSIPMTVVFRKESGDWKTALISAVPLAPEEG